jgi:hypothetical protein
MANILGLATEHDAVSIREDWERGRAHFEFNPTTEDAETFIACAQREYGDKLSNVEWAYDGEDYVFVTVYMTD